MKREGKTGLRGKEEKGGKDRVNRGKEEKGGKNRIKGQGRNGRLRKREGRTGLRGKEKGGKDKVKEG